MKNQYKQLFEGKFTTTFSHDNLSLHEKIYYYISPTTYTERVLYGSLQHAVSLVNKNKATIEILDLGCGGGHSFLTKFGNVSGIDISMASIKNAKKIYKKAIIGDITKKMPFQYESFDLVFCSEVFGHIKKEDKNKFISEIKRVLKPNGVLVMSAETYGKNWLTDFLKRKKIYKKYWINHQGHIGLYSPKMTVSAIDSFLDVIETKKTSTWVLPIDGYLIFINSGFIHRLLHNSAIRRCANILISPLYYLSLILSKFNSANDIVLISRKQGNKYRKSYV